MKRSEFKRWMEELRSGNQIQTFGKLVGTTYEDGVPTQTFCAIGVAECIVGIGTDVPRNMWSKAVALNDCRKLPFPKLAEELEQWAAENENVLFVFTPEEFPA